METRTLLFPTGRFIGPGTHAFTFKVETTEENWFFGELIETVTVTQDIVQLTVPEPEPGCRPWFFHEALGDPEKAGTEDGFIVVRDDDEAFWGEGGKSGFMARLIQRNREDIAALAKQHGWDLDSEGLPLPPIQTFSKAAFEAENKKLMAHIIVEVGIFKSVGDAKRNGWDKPIETGDFCLTKRKVRFKVVD